MKLLLLLLLSPFLLSPGTPAAPPRLPPHQSGDLARDRLGKMASVLLSGDTVSVGASGRPGLPPAQSKAVLARLSDLTLNDFLYVNDANSDIPDKSRPVVLQIGEFGHQVQVSVWRDKPLMTITSEDLHGWVTANYLPVIPKVVSLLKAIDPNDPGLSMTLATAPPLPSTKGIPASALARIATLKPGMTRTDVLRLFTTEGGISTTYWNHYVYRSIGPAVPGRPDGMMPVPGGLVKVDVDFAPRDADVFWLGGRGFWLHRNDYESRRKPLDPWGHPDDVVLRVSPPYIQMMIAN